MTIGEVEKVFLLIDSVLTEVLTVKQASYHLKYHQRTIQRWADEGKLTATYFGGVLWLDAVEIYSVAKALDSKPDSVAS